MNPKTIIDDIKATSWRVAKIIPTVPTVYN